MGSREMPARAAIPSRDIRMRFVRVPELAPPPAAREPLRLAFLLPRALTLGIVPGTQHPCLHQCLLRIERHRDRDYMVHITATTRAQCFAEAARYLRVAAKGHIGAGAALTIAALLITPARPGAPGGRDGWTIIVGADVAFAPTALGAELPGVTGDSP